MAKVHIGKKIREILKKSGHTVETFAKMIHISVSGANQIFTKPYIATEQLENISKVLKHDFFTYFSQDLGIAKEPKQSFKLDDQDQFSKIFSMLEKINKRMDHLDERLPQKKQPAKKKYPPKPRPKKNK